MGWFVRSRRELLAIVGAWAIASVPLLPMLITYQSVHRTLHLVRDVNEVKRFSADLADGYVWGRGTIDNKAHGIMALISMIALKRQGVRLHRGVEVMVSPDEEAGGHDPRGDPAT